MKKWIMTVLVGVLMANSASAAWWSFGVDEKTEEQPAVERPQRGRLEGQHKRPRMSAEKRAEMKACREETQKMVDVARAETDPIKKAELVERLRAQLTEGAEKMQAAFRKRLEKAEQGVEKMKVRLAKGDENMKQRVEEHLQKFLSGEKPERSQRKRFGKKSLPSTSN